MACPVHPSCASNDMENFKSKNCLASPGSVMTPFTVAWLQARMRADEGSPKARRQFRQWAVWLWCPILRLSFRIHAYISYRKIKHREVITALLLCKISKFML